MVTTAAIDIHRPNVSSDLFSGDAPLRLRGPGAWASSASESASGSTGSSGSGSGQSDSSHTLCSSRACSSARERSPEPGPGPPGPAPAARDLLSSLSEDPCPAPGSTQTSPELERRVHLLNRRNQEGFPGPRKPALFPAAAPALHRFSPLEPQEQPLHRVPEA